MEEIFYYLREEETNAPVVTVCLIVEDGAVCRGVAVCSVVDNPKKQTGRELASARAMVALSLRCNSLPVDREDILGLLWSFERCEDDADFEYACKSEYNPILSCFEKKLLKRLERSVNET